MNTVTLGRSTHLAGVAINLVLLATLLGAWAIPSQAAQNIAQFSVAINLQTNNGGLPNAPNAGLCRSGSGIGTFGATLTVFCATGVLVNSPSSNSSLPWTTTQDSSYRFMLNVYKAGQPLGTVDSYTGAGTVTSWRMINLNQQDYLEMMVHW